ncbi:probable cytochrome P450 4aa1 [Cylas formicarius]|uniref:probable cytochrome P450 4aa1 n=1 Tax=Cylas formicarius TaxID=197179 RepID=UPI00295857B9|nr:probable cytochrome P450 4aa1 [Cylas formicarius]
MTYWTIIWGAAFAAVLAAWARRGLRNYARVAALAFRMPGPKVTPLFGNILLIKDDRGLEDVGTTAYQNYGPIFRCWLFFVPAFFVYEPEHLKILFSHSKLSEKNFPYSVMHTFLGDGLVTSTGAKWRMHRRLIQPYFHVNVLENYVDTFAEYSDGMVKALAGKKYVEITRVVNDCVLRVLHKTVLGVTLGLDRNSTPFRRGELLLIKRLLRPWLLVDLIFRRSQLSTTESRQKSDLHAYTKEILRARTGGGGGVCLLDMLADLARGRANFDENDVVNEAVTFMLTGQDSVGAAVAFCLHFLAANEHEQSRARAEIDDIFGADSTPTFKMAQLNEMHYLEQCVKESLRLAPSVPIVSRVLKRDVHLEGYTIPRGANVFVSPFITHRLPQYYPDPLKFDPDRFSPENSGKMHPYAFLPFSAGPRNCIGSKFAILEMKTIIAAVLKNYRIGLMPGRERLQLGYRVTLRARNGIWLEVWPRSEC